MADTPRTSVPATHPPSGVPAPSRSLAERVVRYRWLWLFAVATFAVDQITKLWVIHRLPFGAHFHGPGDPSIIVVRGFFYLIHVGNTGAAWSMFSGQSGILATLAVSTLLAIYLWRHALGLQARLTQVAFGLLCGGIVGNLTDRLAHHHVIDFLDLHFGSYVYPTFNIADSGIFIGVALYLWQTMRTPAGDKVPSTK